MRALSASELLEVWERGLGQSPAQRALILLGVACEESSVAEVAACSVGERDARLLALREETFGPQLACLTSCPKCAGELEFGIETALLRGPARPPSSAPLQITAGDLTIDFRLPNSLDLASLDRTADTATNRRQLLERCLIKAERGEAAVDPAELPEDAVAALSTRMAEADPAAETKLALACPECGHAWRTHFDIVSYFWSEIRAWAQRRLHEVHTLAAAYGWGETEILALSPARRRAYLELVGG